MKRRPSSLLLVGAGSVPFLCVFAVGLSLSVFEGLSYGAVATVRTAFIFCPSLVLGVLYIRRAAGIRERGVIVATLAVVPVQLVFLAASMPGFRDSRAPAYWAAVRSDAASLSYAQDFFRADQGRYSANLDSLQFRATDGVDLDLRSSDDGWSARLTHSLLGPEYACAIWGGTATPVVASGGRVPPEPGQPLCYRSHRLSGLGTVGDRLFDVHQRVSRFLDLSNP